MVMGQTAYAPGRAGNQGIQTIDTDRPGPVTPVTWVPTSLLGWDKPSTVYRGGRHGSMPIRSIEIKPKSLWRVVKFGARNLEYLQLAKRLNPHQA